MYVSGEIISNIKHVQIEPIKEGRSISVVIFTGDALFPTEKKQGDETTEKVVTNVVDVHFDDELADKNIKLLFKTEVPSCDIT